MSLCRKRDDRKVYKMTKIDIVSGFLGAGKTTLFTSIKLCLYGYRESGYQAINAYYKRQIKKLINDKAYP